MMLGLRSKFLATLYVATNVTHEHVHELLPQVIRVTPVVNRQSRPSSAPGVANDMMAVTTTHETTRWLSNDIFTVTGHILAEPGAAPGH